MEYYISQILVGISSGSLYGLLGLSLMFVYRSTRVFNFALGQMATTVVFAAYFLMNIFPTYIAIPLAFLFGFAFGALIEICVLKMVRERTETSTIIVTIGLFAIINSINCWVFGYDPYRFPSPFPAGAFTYGKIVLSYQSLGILACTFSVAFGLYILFRHTLLGFAFQGMSEDQTATKLKGVRVEMLFSVAWGISVALSGAAGMLAAHSLFLHPNTLSIIMLYAFASAIIGGLQSSFGALAGGVLVGITESLAGSINWIGSELKTTAVFIVLLVFLVVRPRGLFGRDEYRKI